MNLLATATRSACGRLVLSHSWHWPSDWPCENTRPMPLKYQNYDLHLFRQMSKISRRVTAQEIDELIRPA